MTAENITLEQARDRLRADYWEDVRDIVRDARDEIKAGRLLPINSSINDYLWESCDQHQRVIYTHLNLDTLCWSSNHDAMTEEMGTDGVTTDGVVNWPALAFAALYHDVMEQAHAENLFDETMGDDA